MPADVGITNPGDVTALEHDMSMRLERLRVREALNARDVAVTRLADACASVREKTSALEALREEKEALQRRLDVALGLRDGSAIDKENEGKAGGDVKTGGTADVYRQMAVSVKAIESRVASLKMSEGNGTQVVDEIENNLKAIKQKLETTVGAGPPEALRDSSNDNGSSLLPSPVSAYSTPKEIETPESPWMSIEGERVVTLPTVSTAEKIETRYAILAALPLPSGIPDDSLTPILIPSPHSLHDFIGTTSGLLRSQLGNYRVFQQQTTTWCPEREEHGYFLTPVFKCSTNPRVSTAHRWSVADISSKLDKPTECFYNKDGKWYYAGVYKSFRLDDLCTQEWECLSPETSQALIKETLAARKNSSPQNSYETGQLYAVGALKIACIGLQCIGFNNTLYRGLLEHAALCTQTGKWRAPGGGFNAGLGLAVNASWGGVHSTPSGGLGSPASIGSVPGAVALCGRLSVSGPATGPGPGLGLGHGQPAPKPPSTSTVRILQHGTQDVSGTPGARPFGK